MNDRTDRHDDDTDVVANHHADHAGFSGIRGYLAAFTMFPGRSSIGRLAAKLTDLTANERVLDIGCGPGAATRVAASMGASVIGVDPSSEMLNLARWTSRRVHVDWREGRAETLPLAEDEVDVVWSLATVHHWPDLAGGLAEVRRVLRPGGRFVAVEKLTKPGATGLASHGWTEAQAHRFAVDCTTAGFVDVDVTAPPRRRSGRIAVTACTPT